ncbi:MAG: hypothetical protein ACE5JD_18060, partial [Candidatus Methylomirabilia bacterium]
GSAAEGGVESRIAAGERSGGGVGEEVSGASWRGPGLGDFGGESEVREDLMNDPRVFDGREQPHAAATGRSPRVCPEPSG